MKRRILSIKERKKNTMKITRKEYTEKIDIEIFLRKKRKREESKDKVTKKIILAIEKKG